MVLEDDGSGNFPFARAVPGPLEKSAMGWEIYPDGLQFFLERMARDYTGDLPLIVTENGIASGEGHRNDRRLLPRCLS